jgi:flavin reductase (DIM6/NTAB) family NADH-FMN oxidoreductase RutF
VELNPRELSTVERYKLLIGGIIPRPIAVVSTRDSDGRVNLAPFSFFSGVGSDPMSLLFCPANKPDGTEKDSLRNASPVGEGGTGEFVVNVTPDRLAEKISAAAEPLKHGESEFEFAGLDEVAATVVSTPRLQGSPVCYECRTLEVIRMNPGVASGGNIVIGEIVHVYVDDAVINERLHIDPAGLDLVGRMGGFEYSRTRDRFSLRPGQAGLDEGRQ